MAKSTRVPVPLYMVPGTLNFKGGLIWLMGSEDSVHVK